MFKKIKSKLAAGKTWVHENLFLAGLLIAAGWFFWPAMNFETPDIAQNVYDQRARNSMSMDMAVAEESMGSSVRRMAMKSIAPPVAGAEDFDPSLTDRKIIKSGNLSIEVPTPEAIRETVESTIKSLDAYISNLNSWEVRSGVLAYSFTVRVPSERFEEALQKLSELGLKKSESYNEQDITSQYQDTEAQIANFKARRDSLRDLMSRRSDSLSDLLAVDRELSSVQQQIERLERTQKTRDNQVAYSVINFSVQPEPQIGDVANPYWSAERSWRQSVNDLIVALQNIADRAIWLVVFAPIWIPILIAIWLFRRWRKRRKQ